MSSKLRDAPTTEFAPLSTAELHWCRSSLKYFMFRAWPIVEPARKLLWNWHLDAICDHLEAVFPGDLIKDMVITIPAGTTKTRASGVFWPAWVWLFRPDFRWLFVGNSQDGADEASMAMRRLVESHWYRRNFGIDWKLRDDKNTASWYENTRGGHRLALGIGSSIVGRKGDAVVVDDANDAEKVESLAERRRVIRKYEASIWDRVIDPETGRHVVIGHRSHEGDLQGHLIAGGGVFELRIPEEFNPARRYRSPLGWTDPRTTAGQLLRPKQLGPKLAEKTKKRNLLLWAAKHNQEPRSKEGIRFKKAWLDKRRWKWDTDREHILLIDPERGVYRFHWLTGVRHRFGTADGASSAKTTADYTVVSSWIITDRWDLVWLGCGRIQAEIPDQPEFLKAQYEKFRLEWCSIEAVFSNVALYQFASRTNMTIRACNPGSRDKLARATPAIVLVENGSLWLPDADTAVDMDFPLDAVEDELTAFTGDEKLDKNDDVVDTLSYAVAERGTVGGGPDSGNGPAVVPSPIGGSYGLPAAVPPPDPYRPPVQAWHGQRNIYGG